MIATFFPAYSPTLPQSTDYVRVLPEIVLSVFGMIVMVMEPLLDERTGQKVLGIIAFVGSLAGLGATWIMAQAPGLAFWNTVQVDGFSVFSRSGDRDCCRRDSEFVRIHGGTADSRWGVLRAGSFWRGGHGADVLSCGAGADFYRPRNFLNLFLCTDRISAA